MYYFFRDRLHAQQTAIAKLRATDDDDDEDDESLDGSGSNSKETNIN